MILRGIRKLLRRDELPDGFPVKLDADEHVLAVAELSAGGHAVATSLGMWLPAADGVRLLGWHLISKASWQNGALSLVEATEVADLDGAVLIHDLAPQRLRLREPGKLPEVVHARVTGSIKSRHHRDLPRSADARSADAPRGADARSADAPRGGAWFVQRKVPGRDGILLQVRPDPDTDADAVRQVAIGVVRTLRGAR